MSLLARFENPPLSPLTEGLFLRLLGLVYLSAFASMWPQALGLFGEHGIAPTGEALLALQKRSWSKGILLCPDGLLVQRQQCRAHCCMHLWVHRRSYDAFRFYSPGMRLQSASCFICPSLYPASRSPAFNGTPLLLECGFLALFSGAGWLIWAYRFLLFRLMFESGSGEAGVARSNLAKSACPALSFSDSTAPHSAGLLCLPRSQLAA